MASSSSRFARAAPFAAAASAASAASATSPTFARQDGSDGHPGDDLGAQHVIWGPVENLDTSSSGNLKDQSSFEDLHSSDSRGTAEQERLASLTLLSASEEQSSVGSADEQLFASAALEAPEEEGPTAGAGAQEAGARTYRLLAAAARPPGPPEQLSVRPADPGDFAERLPPGAAPRPAASLDARPAASSSGGVFDNEREGEGPRDAVAESINRMLEHAFRNETGLWSRGSALHVLGNCKACHYIHTKDGCANGLECNFCHMPHTGKDSSRVCLPKRSHCKRVLEALRVAYSEDSWVFQDLCERVGRRSKYMQNIMREETANLRVDSTLSSVERCFLVSL